MLMLELGIIINLEGYFCRKRFEKDLPFVYFYVIILSV